MRRIDSIEASARARRAAWLAALLDPRSRCELVAAALMRRRQPWSTVHPDAGEHLVILCERGAVLVDTGAADVRIDGGGLVWIPPGVPRRVHGDPARPLVRHLNVRFRLRKGTRDLAADAAPLVLAQAHALRPALDELLAFREDPGPFPSPRLRGLLATLATGCFALAGRRGEALGLDPRRRLRLQEFLSTRLHEAIGPADLAAATGLSLDWFSRRFRAAFGVAPRRHLLEERMRAAAERLAESDAAIAEVGRDVGVRDANLFSRQFRAVFGLSPGAYRRRARVALQR